ncbi:MAG: helix-turn-helix domain-containing protein [Deltaproteobacteria bacterium]|nr:helix-turn-helix domain-containing protein [Deltaproteobacteria bacterium]
MPRRPRSVIDQPARIELLASPTRLELVDTLDALGREATVLELSAQLGRPVAGLYYHLRLLARGGVIEELAGAGSGRRYRVPPAMRLRYHPGKTSNARAVGKAIASMLRVSGRDFAAALRDPRTVAAGPQRALWAARVKGWVSAADLSEINRLIARLGVLVRPERKPGADRLVALSWVLTPVPVKIRRGPRSGGTRRRPPR